MPSILKSMLGGVFMAPDEGGTQGDGSAEEPPAAGVGQGEDPEIVYVSSPDEVPKGEEQGESQPDPNELAQQNQQLQEKLQQLEQQADVASNLQQSIQDLGKQLQGGQQTQQQQAPQQQPQQQPGESDADFRKRVNETLYDDPASVLDEAQNRKLQPLVGQMINNNVTMGRQLLQMDPNKGPTYKQYQQEIDQEVSQIPPMEKLKNPNVYHEAHDRVLARHINDVVDEKVEKLVQQRMEEMQNQQGESQGQQQAAAQASTGGQQFNERTTYRPSQQQRKQYRVLTPQEKQQAQAKGMSQDRYWEYLYNKGLK